MIFNSRAEERGSELGTVLIKSKFNSQIQLLQIMEKSCHDLPVTGLGFAPTAVAVDNSKYSIV
jgi:hypothetical protein